MASFVRNCITSVHPSATTTPTRILLQAAKKPETSLATSVHAKKLFHSSSGLEASSFGRNNRRRLKNQRRAHVTSATQVNEVPSVVAQHEITTPKTSVFTWPEPQLGPLSPVDKVCPLAGARGTLDSLPLKSREVDQDKKVIHSLLADLSNSSLFSVHSNFERLMSYESHIDRHTTMLIQALHHSLQPRPTSTTTSATCAATAAVAPAGLEIEYKSQSCPHLIKKVLNDLFPSIQLPAVLSVLTIAYKTEHDQAAWSSPMEIEREKLYASFACCAQMLCDKLRREGRFWADFIDPGTGKPFYSAYTQSSLFETDDAFQRLGFHISDVGCCKFIEHAVWGSKVFVGVLFTNAPHDAPILNKLTEVKKDADALPAATPDTKPAIASLMTDLSQSNSG